MEGSECHGEAIKLLKDDKQPDILRIWLYQHVDRMVRWIMVMMVILG